MFLRVTSHAGRALSRTIDVDVMLLRKFVRIDVERSIEDLCIGNSRMCNIDSWRRVHQGDIRGNRIDVRFDNIDTLRPHNEMRVPVELSNFTEVQETLVVDQLPVREQAYVLARIESRYLFIGDGARLHELRVSLECPHCALAGALEQTYGVALSAYRVPYAHLLAEFVG